MKIFKYQLPIIFWAALIYILSSFHTLPHVQTPFIASDKLAHAFVYFVFCGLCYRALFFQERYLLIKNHALLIAFIFTCLYGYLDEVHQLYVPGRDYDLLDLLADCIGAFLFVVIIYIIRKRQRNNYPQI